jgi:hypothetical protein
MLPLHAGRAPTDDAAPFDRALFLGASLFFSELAFAFRAMETAAC